MPLIRDQQARSDITTSVAGYTTSKQHQRTAGLNLVDGDRPATPQNGLDKRPHSQTQRDNVNSNGASQHVGKKFSLDASIDSASAFNGFKLNVPNTMTLGKPKRQETAAPSHGRTQAKQQQKPPASNREETQKKARNVSAFDDTASIGPSMLEDSNLDDNVTAMHIPQPQPEPQKRREPQISYHNSYGDHDLRGNYDTQAVMEQMGIGENWQDEVAEERAHQAQNAGYVPTPQRGANPFNYTLMKSNMAGRMSAELLDQPETPSRVRSVPPEHDKVHAPVPKRTVGFVNSPQIMGGMTDSPQFRSEELARENSPAMSISRPNSAHPVAHSMPIHQRTQQMQLHPHNRQQSSQPPHTQQPNRFQSMQDHRNRMMQQEQKVSAPESDIQNSSEDERAARMQLENLTAVPKQIDNVLRTSKKRSLDDVNVLDYDADVLSRKKLGDLQKEPYTQNPRAPARIPATDSNGNEMRLPQILENLSRMAQDQQQAILSTLTDEEWAQTGQWFVEKFASDLEKLMEVRLKRRQIALTFEDSIRRRQRQVEYQQAGVEKQLKELQEGGAGLLKDRPATGGSRAGTPLRTPRG